MAFAGLEASEDLCGRKLQQYGWKESSDSSMWVSGDIADGHIRRRRSYSPRSMREGSGGSKADCSDWQVRRGAEQGGYAENTVPSSFKSKSGDFTLARRIRVVREAEEQSRQIREVAWEAGILGPHGIIEASPTNSDEPHLPHGGVVQTSVESGIVIDLNAITVIEEGTTMQRTIQEPLGNQATVEGNLGFQSKVLTYGSDPFNLGPLIFGQPDNSKTGGVGFRSKRGREEEKNGRMDKRGCAGNRLASDCCGTCSMGFRKMITFNDTLIQEAKTDLRSPRAS
ncbi:unnamed protein product [Prunus armeniaca]|uniref:Uncharacterized protein n=1 Tax=Prunus armeniaca TaxID=36596 RepID=A0A6J5WGW7_PRUAR|nr:unnamed protein product [Prunus armeniaca]